MKRGKKIMKVELGLLERGLA